MRAWRLRCSSVRRWLADSPIDVVTPYTTTEGSRSIISRNMARLEAIRCIAVSEMRTGSRCQATRKVASRLTSHRLLRMTVKNSPKDEGSKHTSQCDSPYSNCNPMTYGAVDKNYD